MEESNDSLAEVNKQIEINMDKNHRVKTSVNNNFIDKDVQSVFFPLNLIPNIILFPKYRIKDNHIRPNSLLTNVVSFIATVVIVIFLYGRVSDLHNHPTIRSSSATAYGTAFIGFIINSIGFIINYILNLKHSRCNIMFVVKFQQIHRFLNNKTDFKFFIVRNWILIMLTLVFYFCYAISISTLLQYPIYKSFYGFISIYCDANIIYAIRLLMLLTHKIDLWKVEVQNLQQKENGSHKDYCTKMLEAYQNILHCYVLYKSSFQFMVSF